MIGDSSGLRWSFENGRTKTKKLPAAEQTKFLTSLLIYRLMGASAGTLTPETFVHEYAPGWPSTENGGKVKMRHLLSETTGLVADYWSPGCVRGLAKDEHETESQKWYK